MTLMKSIQSITGSTLTIELPPEFAGHEVQIEVRILEKTKPVGEGLRRYAELLKDVWTDEDDQILARINDERKQPCHREIPE